METLRNTATEYAARLAYSGTSARFVRVTESGIAGEVAHLNAVNHLGARFALRITDDDGVNVVRVTRRGNRGLVFTGSLNDAADFLAKG